MTITETRRHRLTESLAVAAARAFDAVRDADPCNGSRTLAPRIFIDTVEDCASDVILAALRGRAVRVILAAARPSEAERRHGIALRMSERKRARRVAFLSGFNGDTPFEAAVKRINASIRASQIRRQYGVVC